MKKILFILIALFSISYAYSQNISPSATYQEAQTKKVRGLVNTYVTESGESFSVGDTITIGKPFDDRKSYLYVTQNAGIELLPLTNLAEGEQVIIKKIKIQMKTAYIFTTKIKGYVYGLRFVTERALKFGELKSKVMSSDEALAELKKAKDKLDLGLITQEEFNALRAELAPLIK